MNTLSTWIVSAAEDPVAPVVWLTVKLTVYLAMAWLVHATLAPAQSALARLALAIERRGVRGPRRVLLPPAINELVASFATGVGGSYRPCGDHAGRRFSRRQRAVGGSRCENGISR